MATQELPTTKETSAGALVYSFRGKIPYIVLMVQDNAFYKREGEAAKRKVVDIGPKGGMNEGEDILEAASREIEEETGLTLEIKTDFHEENSYSFIDIARRGPYAGKRANIIKTVVYYAAEASEAEIKRIKLSPEHKEMMIVPLDKAIAMTKEHEAMKIELLKKLREWLTRN
jgi:ADP-ribose pyrophosphatase YjhB (NUDIX family)